MKLQDTPLHPLPGTEVVGRGIYLRPRQPYALKDALIKQDKWHPYYSKETEQHFFVYAGYQVNDSPYMDTLQKSSTFSVNVFFFLYNQLIKAINNH